MKDEDKSIEDRLNEKLEKGEIEPDEYNRLLKKHQKKEDQSSPPKHKKSSYTGSSTIEGGEFPSTLRVSGKLQSSASVTCLGLKVSGKVNIADDLTITGAASISGKLNVDRDLKIAEDMKLSGKTNVGNRAYFGGRTKISGKMNVGDRLTSEDDLLISGKITAHDIKSTADIKVSGKITTETDISCKDITTTGSGHIGGNLIADNVIVNQRYRERAEMQGFDKEEFTTENKDSIAGLVSNIVTTTISNVFGSFSGQQMRNPGILKIDGDIEAKKVDLSYTVIKGDIKADEVLLGPEVIVEGKIIYSDSITIPQDSSYDIQQIDETK